MDSLHLVDLEGRDFVQAFPLFDPARDGVEPVRQAVLSAVTKPLQGEERFVPGPSGGPDVRILIYRPESVAGSPRALAPAMLYLHGGGFIAGTPDIADAANVAMANRSGAVIVAVAYRLAPEVPFPGPIEDCYAALKWLAAHAEALGVDAARISVFGHSAGGGLAAALSLLARDRSEIAIASQFLIYPMLDSRTGSIEEPVKNSFTGEFMWTRKANNFGWNAMRGGQQIPSDRLGHFAPALEDDLSGLPKTFIAVGTLDLFFEEDVAFALRLTRAGVPTEMHCYPGGVHRFDDIPGALALSFETALQSAFKRFLY